MATLVSFHAHPDDESISTGGTLAKAAAAGHRVVLVFATRGEHGEVADGFLDDEEHLAQRRVKETLASAEVLGVERVEFLGYHDSGMKGTPENDLPEAFWQADVDEAADRLARILTEESADVLTVYDSDGGYGHPDHIQVHRVGIRAAQQAGTRRVYEATMNRDAIRRMMEEAVASGAVPREEVPDVTEQGTFGRPESALTTAVDVRGHLAQKRASMRAHASQIDEQSFFLAMDEAVFEAAFGTEWYIRHGEAGGIRESDLFEGLA
ncbi:MAG: PIG-L family deacetylase [Actinomycetota bacterium]